MNGAFQYLDIILFASIAVFLIVKLAGVLGKRTGHEQDTRRNVQPFPTRRQTTSNTGDTGDNVIALPDREMERAVIPPDSPAAEGLGHIASTDSSFSPGAFLTGARAAFEMIVSAFAAGDDKALKRLLSPAVLSDFEAAITARREAGQVQDTTLIGIKTIDIVAAGMDDSVAQVTVRFVSEQVNVTKDEEGRVIDGDPNFVADVTDIWTFSRDTQDRDPNWWLSATSAPEQ